jgi:hypothetical protein
MESFTILSEDQWYNIPEEREASFRALIGQKRKGRANNTGFFVNDSDELRLVGKFLENSATAFYHSDYNSGGTWRVQGTIENMIWTLKNDVDAFPERLLGAQQQLAAIVGEDFPQILKQIGKTRLTVCVVPRSKAESYYRKDQLLFRETIGKAVAKQSHIENGTKYIIRHTNTRTTHLDRNGDGGDGNLPYPGITKETCTISEQVKGKDILLIDDLYTKSVNIDEDAIQAVLDNGAKSATLYSVGKTVSKKSITL